MEDLEQTDILPSCKANEMNLSIFFYLPVSLVILTLMSIVMTIFVRPFTWQQLLFTIIPIIPIIYAWDGQASLMRTYTFEDIESLLEGNQNENYVWEIDDAKNAKGKKVGYFIKGYSRNN